MFVHPSLSSLKETTIANVAIKKYLQKLCIDCVKLDFFLRESIFIGYTQYTEQEVRHIIEEMGRDFKGESYHLMKKNCNDFSGALTQVCSFALYISLFALTKLIQ